VLVALIGPRWKLARLHEGGDVLHDELTLALAAPDKVVIPVLAFGGELPKHDALPADLRALPETNTLAVPDNAHWPEFLERIVRDVRSALDTPRP
jgi:hypothetical protein